MIIFFIPIREKSEKDRREEMEREERWRKAIEEDERRRKEREYRIKCEKEKEEINRIKKLEKEYEEARRKDPWQYQFMPEGWSIFGQTNFNVITEF